ncbi:hypothetical protein K1719_024335 [Acacia pycnantha]|nr:hypothetical protein K1719_024335 [Acacia pycnantha]
MVLKVFGAANTACPQRVLACFIEKGVDFELIHVDLNRGDHKSPDFLLRQDSGVEIDMDELEVDAFLDETS